MQTPAAAVPPAVRDAVVEVLRGATDGMRTRDVLAALRDRGARIPRAMVEAALRDDNRITADGADDRARWSVDAGPPPTVTDVVSARLPRAVAADAPLAGLALRDWQVAAFAAWAQADCRGVVEAVTGAGKTRLAIAAVRAGLARGGRVLVLAPTLDLVEQWVRELRTHVPAARVGRLGGGSDADLHDHHVVVATPHSAAAVPLDLPAGTVGLLVADEAHRYGAPTWGAALAPGFRMRLALTATYERNDDGIEDVLGPYFGGVVHRYRYVDAAADGVIAPFEITFAGTALDDAERASYAAADRRARELFGVLTSTHGFPRDPMRAIQAASELVARGARGGATDDRVMLDAARGWLGAIRARRDVAAQCAGKLDVVRAAAPALAGHRTLVFTDTVDQAEQAVRILSAAGLAAEELHGELTRDRRRIRLAQFARGRLDVLAAPRVLDEGVDVPDADVAIVLASFRTRRQTIQRLGRVLRRKQDDRHARLVIAFAQGTREDPADGAHEAFLDEVLPVARRIETIDVDRSPEALARVLTPVG